MSDYAVQRTNMVESQVRPSDVTDRRIIRAMLELPREAFVPSQMRSTAYMDEDLTLVRGDAGQHARAMMAPRVLAKLIQLAVVEDSDIVLDIGCLTGYSTAVLARMAQTVVGLESDEALAARASKLLAEQSVDNAVVETGALAEGVAGEAPFDVIVLEGALPQVPAGLLDQLKDGGRLVAIQAESRRSEGRHAEGRFGKACLWKRVSDSFDCRPAFDAGAFVLSGFERVPEFML